MMVVLLSFMRILADFFGKYTILKLECIYAYACMHAYTCLKIKVKLFLREFTIIMYFSKVLQN